MSLKNIIAFSARKTGLSELAIKRCFAAAAIVATVGYDVIFGSDEVIKIYREAPVTTVLLVTLGTCGALHAWVLKRKGPMRARLKVEAAWMAVALAVGVPADYYTGTLNLAANRPLASKPSIVIHRTR